MTKTLIITGGSRGIGKATIEFMKEKSWDIVNISRSACDVDGVKSFSIDLSDRGALEKNKDDLQNHFTEKQKICLVHNAALYHSDATQDLPAEKLREVLEVNLIAPLHLNQIFLEKMAEGSSIIYIGSTLAVKAVKNRASYVTSKHALIGLMRSTCQDYDGLGIHTCAINPGFTETEMLLHHIGSDPNVKQNIADKTALHRLIQPKEIAKFIEFCAENPVVNGADLGANLGQLQS